MSTIYHFTMPWPVLDVLENTLVKDRNDGVLLANDGTEVQATTPLGVVSPIRTGPSGTTSAFLAPIPAGRVRFGTVEAAVFADENMIAAPLAEKAAADAAATRAAVEHLAANASEISYLRRDANGDVWVTQDPVVSGGGFPRVTPEGDVIVSFPI